MFPMTVCPHSAENPRNSEGDIIELRDGRLLLVWTEFTGGYVDHAAAWLRGKTSCDGGESWSESFAVAEAPYGANLMSVSLLRNRANHLLLFYLWKLSTKECHVFVRLSRDEATSWEEPIPVSSLPGYHVMNNARVIMTSCGRLLAPVAWNNRVFCYLSNNDGLEWRQGAGYAEICGGSVYEPGLVELNNGDIMMIIRTPHGFIYKAISTDAGETWGTPTAMPLISPSSPATVSRIPSTGDLLMVWNNQLLGAQAKWADRTPLTSAISSDEGATWRFVKSIEQDPQRCFAYTSVDFIQGSVYLTYYAWTKGRANFDGTDLELNVKPVEWFYE